MDKVDSRNWKWMAPLGLSLIGLGLSITGEGIILKMEEVHWLTWGAWGTVGLICTNSGISVFGDAVKRRFWFEWHEKQQEIDQKVDN
ncbi:MAG: hypothetical protein AAGC85_07185 [Bacteroidota bacterium]